MQRYFGFALALLLLCAGAHAFPLSGGDLKANATVYGVVEGDTEDDNAPIYVDIGSNLDYYTLVLVDDDDKFYTANYLDDSASDAIYINGVPSHNVKRKLWQFTIPATATIKRLRLEPKDSFDSSRKDIAPFSIDWEGIPEVSNNNVTIKFYGAQTKGGYFDRIAWVFGLKITNNGTQNLIVVPSDFVILDQYDWRYPGGNGAVVEKETQLIPGESMKFDLDVIKVSPLSRPVELRYGDLRMDISAWS
jgi:hypothetical protein